MKLGIGEALGALALLFVIYGSLAVIRLGLDRKVRDDEGHVVADPDNDDLPDPLAGGDPKELDVSPWDPRGWLVRWPFR
jgi:hypothetical protein